MKKLFQVVIGGVAICGACGAAMADASVAKDNPPHKALAKSVERWRDWHFGRELAIEVSEDGQAWKEAKRVNDCRGGCQVITFDPVEGRWIRMHGIKRGTEWGYSIWEMRVFAK